jgi:4-diphosphocytidyl-2C-methyl-D-erythritol kinase
MFKLSPRTQLSEKQHESLNPNFAVTSHGSNLNKIAYRLKRKNYFFFSWLTSALQIEVVKAIPVTGREGP